jgi:hypothetical protein
MCLNLFKSYKLLYHHPNFQPFSSTEAENTAAAASGSAASLMAAEAAKVGLDGREW